MRCEVVGEPGPGDRQQVPAQFSWRGFPADWKLASDLDHLSGVRPGTVEDVVESVAIGGPDLRILDRDINGARLRIATRGSWRFTPEAFADMVEMIIRTENDLWGAPARPFFVPLAPLGGGEAGHSFYGTGRTDAFSGAAGMRNGMRLIRRESGTVGDSSVEVVYRMKAGETERVIRYKPEGKGKVTFQRVIPVPDMAAQACEQRVEAVP